MALKNIKITKLHINIILSSILIISLLGGFSFFYNMTFEKIIVDKGLDYLHSALDKSKSLLLTLSGIKASIAIIEGSSVGVNFGAQASLQLGDSVQSIYDAVDLMWKSSILGLVVLKFQEIFLTLFSRRLIDLGIFIINFILLVNYNFCRFDIFKTKNSKTEKSKKSNLFIEQIFKKTIKIILILLISIYIILPLNILIMGQTSKYINYKYRSGAIKEINQEKENIKLIRTKLEADLNLNKDLNKDLNNNNNNNNNNNIKWYNLEEKISSKLNTTSTIFSNIKKDIFDLIHQIESLGDKTMRLMVILVTLYLLDSILLPAIFLFITYFIIKTYLSSNRFNYRYTINHYYTENKELDLKD